MRRVVSIGGSVVAAGVALQLALKIVSMIAGQMSGGNLASDSAFFGAFLGLALVPLGLLLVVLAVIGRFVRARQDAVFVTRAIWRALAMTIIALALLLADVGSFGGGIIPH